MYDNWAVLEFPEVKQSILGKFSFDVSEPVASHLIRELVDSVDRPGTTTSIKLDTEQELEWVIPVINYAFSLSFISPREYETIRAAIRIYLSWMTSITPEAHKSCPMSMLEHPNRYFRRMLEALRLIFLPRPIPYTIDSEMITERQANEIRNVLGAIKLWTSKVREDYKDETWSRTLLFLMAVNEQLLTIPSSPDDIGSVVAPDLIQSLFDCWINASLNELIPSQSYWKTLTLCSRKWIFHVPLVEIWAQKLLSLTLILVQKLNGDVDFYEYIPEDIKDLATLKETWLRLFHLLGNPAQFLLYENGQVDSNLLPYINGQVSLSFFLGVISICKMVEIFYGNTQITIDFHECEDLYQIWVDACKVVQEEWNRRYNRSRPSNMSSGSSGVSGMNTLSTKGDPGDASTLTYQSLAASNLALASGQTFAPISRKNTANFTQSIGSVRGQKIGQSNRNSQYNPQIQQEPIELPRLRPGQFVWYYLKSNQLTRNMAHESQPKVSHMLEIFLYWLYDPALVSLGSSFKKSAEDVISQHSMSSAEIDSHSTGMAGVAYGGMPTPADSGVTRHSFAQSTTSSSDISSPQNSSHAPPNVFEYPSVDGVAAALGALCRIICAKSSREQLPDEQLAQFYTVVHEALVERDRLMLCSLIYYSVDLFKLGLKGVEILLPNYLFAIDIVLTESMKLRLHPSIHEVEMRHACLRALSSIISWPTTFGPIPINEEPSRLNQGPGNILESNPTYIAMRPRILRVLVHTLRNETDSTNLHLALSLCAIFCEECCRYDLSMANSGVLQEKKKLERQRTIVEGDGGEEEEEERYFAVSVLRGIVSAICDNLCKQQWNSELITSLAALDCLNVIATLPQSIVFSNREMSTGSLIVTSLCRFVDTQLQKPPPFHSRDLHSSVVSAYSSIQIWLCSAPMLTEIDACLTTVAQTIEFGLTGGKGLPPADYKPASQRVYDAAELLLNTLFAIVGKNNSSTFVDERSLLYKYSSKNVEVGKFRHFLVRNHTLVSIHEATHIDEISQGYPTLFLVTRTPFHPAHASVIQLRPKSFESKEDQENHAASDVPSPGALSLGGLGEALPQGGAGQVQKQTLRRAMPSSESKKSLDGQTTPVDQKQFVIPPGFEKPQCKLDTAYPPLQPIPETDKIIQQLDTIKNRLAQGGGSAIGQRDAHNVWIQSSLGSFLSQPPRPQGSSVKCNAGRIFLYDLGFITAENFGKELVPLDSTLSEEFYRDMHQLVDRSATKILQTVGIFYVKDGQRSAGDILDNALAIQTTRPEFCRFLSELGEGVDIATHPDWTGHWATAFSAERKPLDRPTRLDHYMLDGINNCLWWSDNLHEIVYVMFSERSMKLSQLMGGHAAASNTERPTSFRAPLASREMTLDEDLDYTRKSPVHGPSHVNTSLSSSKHHLHQQHQILHTASSFAAWKAHQQLYQQLQDKNSSTASHLGQEKRLLTPPPEVYACPQHMHYSLTIQTDIGGSTESEGSQKSGFSTPSPYEGYEKDASKDYLDFDAKERPMDYYLAPKSARHHSRAQNLDSKIIQDWKAQAYQLENLKKMQNFHSNMPSEDLPYEIETNPLTMDPKNLHPTSHQPRYSPSRNRQYIPRRVRRQSSVSPRFMSTSSSKNTSLMTSKNPSPMAEHDSRRLSEPGYIFEDQAKKRFSRKDDNYGHNSSTLTRKFSESAIVFPQSVFVTDEPIRRQENVKIQVQPSSPLQKNPSTASETPYSLAYFKSLFRKKSPEVKAKNPENHKNIYANVNNNTEETTKSYFGISSPHLKLFSAKSSSVFQTGYDSNLPTSRISDVSQSNVPMTPSLTSHSSRAQRTKSSSTINSETSGPQQRVSSLSSHTHPDKPAKRNPDQRIFVVWLERIEDMYHFPHDHFFQVSEDGSRHTSPRPDYAILFLHNFEPGLVRVHIDGIWTKYGQPGPLVDGMVVFTAALSSLVRQTVISIARRRTIEVDQYQMVHLKRRQAIQEFAKKYTQNIQYLDFLDKFITL